VAGHGTFIRFPSFVLLNFHIKISTDSYPEAGRFSKLDNSFPKLPLNFDTHPGQDEHRDQQSTINPFRLRSKGNQFAAGHSSASAGHLDLNLGVGFPLHQLMFADDLARITLFPCFSAKIMSSFGHFFVCFPELLAICLCIAVILLPMLCQRTPIKSPHILPS